MTHPEPTEADIRAACEEADLGNYLSYVKSWPNSPISRLILALARRIAAEREAEVAEIVAFVRRLGEYIDDADYIADAIERREYKEPKA